ncbi:MAG TPA: sigma-70 family RNA polymerase sigma factor [Chthonomonadaceae bacterium]|nr:sigma-70 family RNA polymerase sigma factor [Chthonomonadaceae bacterium]
MLAEKWQKPYRPVEDLLQRAKAGEREAFDHLFTCCKDGVYACLWHLLDGDADLVEEAVGSVFLSAYRSLSQFRGESALSTWLYRIAVNEAHARLRQQRRRRLFGLLSFQEPKVSRESLPKAEDPAETLQRAEEERLLWQAVNALPEPYRTPVVLRYMSGITTGDIAEVLRRPAGTVRYQLSRGLQILRERLGSEWNR